MNNKTKRNISFVLMSMSVFFYLIVLVKAVVMDKDPSIWEWVVPTLWFLFFLMCFLNYHQAYREEKIYGLIKKKKKNQ